ncbi:MAG: cell wall hydrolase [Clostridiales bacterium]|nr:cell wall hydrolase [Candidatus Blautia equi]
MNRKQYAARRRRNAGGSVKGVVMMVAWGLVSLALLVCTRIPLLQKNDPVYASAMIDENGNGILPSGMAGIASVVEDIPMPGTMIERMGTSCEAVMVGQRFQKVKEHPFRLDISASAKTNVAKLNEKVENMASRANIMSDADYDNLLRIVESEAGTEDIKGRILIANVIMNRMAHPEFPDNISDVICQVNGGVAQFSPVYDGSFYYAVPTDGTKEAVLRAMEGEDYSDGALFFVQRSAAEKNGMAWFDNELVRLFQHGVHEFYRYPTETEQIAIDKANAERKAREEKEKEKAAKTAKEG